MYLTVPLKNFTFFFLIATATVDAAAAAAVGFFCPHGNSLCLVFFDIHLSLLDT